MEKELLEQKLDNNLKMMELVIQQHSGGHSDILSKLKEVKVHLTKQDEKMMNLKNNFNTFRVEINPVIKTVEEIKLQTTATNGSVRRLQLWQATGEGWIKGFGVAVVCIVALIGVIYYSITNQEQKTQALIEGHINKTMQ